MLAVLAKVGGVGILVLWATKNPSSAINYSHFLTLIMGAILVILYGFGFKDNLKYVAALILINVVIRMLLGGFWGIPATGPITQGYNILNHGIDIGVAVGTPVKAARDGKVSKVWEDPVYGLSVMIDHEEGFQSLYAHNSKIIAKEGESISLGDEVSLSGSSGKSSGPHLHFEIRKDGKTVDPLAYLSLKEVQGK